MNMGNNAGLPTLETERLLLRAINENDSEDIYEYSSDEEVSNYMPWKAHQSIEDSITYVKSVIQRYEDKQPSDWGVILKESGKLIGVCGFVSLKPRQRTAKIAYTISRNYWGKGLATEAVKVLLNYAYKELTLNRIEATCYIENIGSERVMQKVGMTYEGVLREATFAKGKFHDLKVYSILAKEHYRNEEEEM